MTAANFTPQTLGRDPDQEPRTLRFMQQTQDIINGLIRAGILVQGTGINPGGIPPVTFGIAGLFFTGIGVPPAILGFRGDHYLDLNEGLLYKNV